MVTTGHPTRWTWKFLAFNTALVPIAKYLVALPPLATLPQVAPAQACPAPAQACPAAARALLRTAAVVFQATAAQAQLSLAAVAVTSVVRLMLARAVPATPEMVVMAVLLVKLTRVVQAASRHPELT